MNLEEKLLLLIGLSVFTEGGSPQVSFPFSISNRKQCFYLIAFTILTRMFTRQIPHNLKLATVELPKTEKMLDF